MIGDAFKAKRDVRQIHMSIHDCGDVVLMVTTMRPGKIVRVISFRRRQQERELFRQKMGHAKLSDRLR